MITEDWGLIDYESSVERQTALVDAVSAGEEERLVLCTHPPVVTLGRGTKPEDLPGWTGATFASSRGGRATYHGPSQIVIYPILNLKTPHARFGERDVGAYLRALESATVTCLREIGLPQAEVRTTQNEEISLTGVWVGPKKIASIGIAVRKWVTYHGVAINILSDPLAFSGIRPCGFQPGIMTNLESETGRRAKIEEIKHLFATVFSSVLA